MLEPVKETAGIQDVLVVVVFVLSWVLFSQVLRVGLPVDFDGLYDGGSGRSASMCPSCVDEPS